LKVLIIGKASLDKNLMRMIKELDLKTIVYLAGILSQKEIYRHLAISDLFVFIETDAYGGASIKSTSLAAAYAAKLPIIGNRGILTDDFSEIKKYLSYKYCRYQRSC